MSTKLIDDIRRAKGDADRAHSELVAAQSRLEDHRQTLLRHLQEAATIAGRPIRNLQEFDSYVVGLEEELRERTLTFQGQVDKLREALSSR